MFGFWTARRRAESNYLEGVRVLDRGDHDLARCWFAEAVRIDRRFALGHLGCGLAHLRSGQFDAAIEFLSEAIRLSHDPRAYFLRSLCYQGKGDFVREETDCNEALRRDRHVEESLRCPVPGPQPSPHPPVRSRRDSRTLVGRRAVCSKFFS